MLLKSVLFATLLLFSSSVTCEDEAVVTCRNVHHTDVDKGAYLNGGCVSSAPFTTRFAPTMCPKESNGVFGRSLRFYRNTRLYRSPHKTNAYAEICIKNGTENQTLPLRDRQSCGLCETPVVQSSAHPVWDFLGGITLTVKSVLSNDDNHKEVRLKIDKGSVADSYVFARITWTKKE